MKKTFLTAVMAVAVLICSAQVQFGLFGGPQVTSSKYTINGKKQPNSQKYGFQLGASLKVPFDDKLYFAPTAFYSLKGYKVKFNQRSYFPDSLAVDNNTTIHTFELAPLLQYDFSNQPGHFFVKFGPSIDFQLSGKEKYNRSDRTTVDRKMGFSFTRYGHYAANFITQLGYETKDGLLLFAQYSHGIGKTTNADGGPGIWHRVIGISIGKYIDKKK
ncbi:MAG: porin family protein [Chitinophagaceae bacterium]